MLTFYAFEDASHWNVFGFAIACAAGSVYGFLQGAWPFGIVEAIWSFIALRRWQRRRLLYSGHGVTREPPCDKRGPINAAHGGNGAVFANTATASYAQALRRGYSHKWSKGEQRACHGNGSENLRLEDA